MSPCIPLLKCKLLCVLLVVAAIICKLQQAVHYRQTGIHSMTFKTIIMSTVINRVQAETPKFFKGLRNMGLILAAISATLLTSDVNLPPLVLKIAEYIAVAGSVMGAVSQTAVKNEEE